MFVFLAVPLSVFFWLIPGVSGDKMPPGVVTGIAVLTTYYLVRGYASAPYPEYRDRLWYESYTYVRRQP